MRAVTATAAVLVTAITVPFVLFTSADSLSPEPFTPPADNVEEVVTPTLDTPIWREPTLPIIDDAVEFSCTAHCAEVTLDFCNSGLCVQCNAMACNTKTENGCEMIPYHINSCNI